MELSQLTAYAQLKFHMREQRPWPDFPGFSVLADPVTGKWAALLMRQWDSDSGEEIQRCDMRCGQQVLAQRPAPFLSKPFRMKGPNWVGVTFHGGTEPETVFRLLDQAVSQSQRGYTIVLEQKPTSAAVVYADTPLSAPGSPSPASERRCRRKSTRCAGSTSAGRAPSPRSARISTARANSWRTTRTTAPGTATTPATSPPTTT